MVDSDPASDAPLLVVAPTSSELTPLRDLLSGHARADVRRTEFLVTGVGKAGCAVELQRAIDRLSPGLILLTGCAGAFPDRGLAPGDVAVAGEEVLGDDGVETDDAFLTLDDLGLVSATREDGCRLANRIPVEPPSDATLDRLRAAASGAYRVDVGPLVTVSSASGSDSRVEVLARRWRPLAESLEGAAAALACWRAGLPFREVRGISNLVGPRDRAAWRIELACERAARVALAWLAAPGPRTSADGASSAEEPEEGT